MTTPTLIDRVKRSLQFRAQSARRHLENLAKHARRRTELNVSAISEIVPQCASKSELLLGDADATWNAADAQTVRTTTSIVFSETGTRRQAELQASLGEASFETPAIVFGRFHDCVAEPHSVRLVTREGRLIAETATIHDILDPLCRDSGHLIALEGKVHRLDRPYPFVDADVIFPFNSFCPSFGHYLLTGLPVVLCFLDEIKSGALKIVIPSGQPPWMTQHLLELGLKQDDVMALPPRPHRFRSAIVCNILDASNTRAPNPASLRWLRARFPGEARVGNSNRQIYVKRAASGNVSSRTISNEADILRLLQSKGFHVVEPERLSLREQIAAFRQADVVISPHGSTLANLIFCRPGTRVLDLMPDDWVGSRSDRVRDVWAMRICSLAGLDYSVLMSPSRILQRHFTGNPTIVSEISVAQLAKFTERGS